MYAEFHIIRLLNHTHTHSQVLLNFPGVSPFGVVKGTPVACDKTNLNQDRWNLFLSLFLVVFLPFFLIAAPFLICLLCTWGVVSVGMKTKVPEVSILICHKWRASQVPTWALSMNRTWSFKHVIAVERTLKLLFIWRDRHSWQTGEVSLIKTGRCDVICVCDEF